MLSENNELATWIFALHRSLTEDGFDADAIMRAADFDFGALTSTTQQVPKKIVADVWKKVEEITGDDSYCLRILHHVSDPYINAFITSVQSSGSIQRVLELLLKYYRVVHSGVDISVDLSPNLIIRIESSDQSKPIRSQDIDVAFGLIVKYGSVLPSKEVKPLKIHFRRRTPKNIKAYEAYFNCPIVFEADENAIEFPIEVLDADIPSANPMLSTHVEQYLAEQMKDSSEFDIIDHVERELVILLPGGTPKLKDVATRLNMSQRTLQRRLQQSEISFSSILNNTRLRLAQEHLENSQHSIENIAHKLGFTEPGNFIRFFKQHTGQTPNQFEK